MNIKRVLAQSKMGQDIRKKIHSRSSKNTLGGAVDFLKNWGTPDDIISDMAKDMFDFCSKSSFTYSEYMFYHFYKKDHKERMEFISSEERIYCCEKLNKANNWGIFENKANTYEKYKGYFKRDVCVVRNPKSKNDRLNLKKFIAKHPCFIAKTLKDAGGVGIKKVDFSKKTISDELCKNFLLDYSNGCLCEEIIIQSDEFANFHPESVNTLRITTVRFNDYIEIIHPAMRIGTGNSFVDNAGSNGILCSISLNTGKIIATSNERGEAFIKHPDTGMKLIGYKIPFFEEAVNLAKELALVVPSNRYTGWDLAHTKNGWILVEANSYGGFVIWQIPLQKGFRLEWEDILKRIKDNR